MMEHWQSETGRRLDAQARFIFEEFLLCQIDYRVTAIKTEDASPAACGEKNTK